MQPVGSSKLLLGPFIHHDSLSSPPSGRLLFPSTVSNHQARQALSSPRTITSSSGFCSLFPAASRAACCSHSSRRPLVPPTPHLSPLPPQQPPTILPFSSSSIVSHLFYSLINFLVLIGVLLSVLSLMLVVLISLNLFVGKNFIDELNMFMT